MTTLRLRTRRSLAVLALAAGSAPACAQSALWDGSVADWDSDHWLWSPSGAGYPDDPGVDAAITAGSVTLRAGAAFRVHDFTLDGGQLLGPGALDIHGHFRQSAGVLGGNVTFRSTAEWTGGSWAGPGTHTVAAGASLLIAQPVANLAGRTLVNLGAVSRESGQLRGSASSIRNDGAWTENGAAASTFMVATGGSAWTFNNGPGGTFTKLGPATTSFTGVAFANAGRVNVHGGVLGLSGGTAAAGSSFDLAEGAQLRLSDYSLQPGVQFTGGGRLDFPGGTSTVNSALSAGEVTFTGATVQLNAEVHAPTIRLTAGVLAGTHRFTGGLFDWSLGGRFNESGSTSVETDRAILSFSGTDIDRRMTFSTRTTHREGWLSIGSGGRVVNNGEWLLTGENQIVFNLTGLNPAPFTNTAGASFIKEGPTHTLFTVGFPLINEGLIEVREGRLTLTSGSSAAGSTLRITGGELSLGEHRIDAGATLDFRQGILNLSGTAGEIGRGFTADQVRATYGATHVTDVIDANSVLLLGGQLQSDDLTLQTRSFRMTSGGFTGPGGSTALSVPGDGSADITGGGVGPGHTLIIAAPVSHTNNPLVNGDGSRIVNRGTWIEGAGGTRVIASDQRSTFTNDTGGVFIKRSVAVSTFERTLFENRGQVTVETGRLVLPSGFQQSSGEIRLAGGSIQGDLTLTGGSLAGAGAITGNVSLAGALLSPGSSPGLLTVIGDLSLHDAELRVDLLGSVRGETYDAITVTGALEAHAVRLTVASVTPSALREGDILTILLQISDAPATDAFEGLPEGAEFAAGPARFRISYRGASGNDVTLTVLQVPGPAALSLVSAPLALRSRRRAR